MVISMNRKKFALYSAAVWAIVGGAVGFSVSTGNPLTAIAAVIVGNILMVLGRKKVTEVLEDERIYRISEKASRRVLEIFGIGSALIGMVLITSNSYAKVGYILAFSACVLLMFYLIFYSYYNRKGL